MEANSEMDYKADCDLRDESGLNKVGIRQLAKRPDSDAIGRGDKVQRAGVGRVGMWRRSMTDGYVEGGIATGIMSVEVWNSRNHSGEDSRSEK